MYQICFYLYVVSFEVTVYWTDKIQIAIHVLRRNAFLICEILYIKQQVEKNPNLTIPHVKKALAIA